MSLIPEYWHYIPLFCQIHFWGSSSFLVQSMEFSMYTIISSAKNDRFILLSNLIVFYFFYLSDHYWKFNIELCWTSNTMLNRSGESEHPCIFPDFRGKPFNFCTLSMMLAIVFSYMAFIMLRYAPSSPGVSKLLASLGYTGRRALVLGHTLNTWQHVITKNPHNVLSKFAILCWAAFIVILSHKQPVDC